jgi:hypothetical protein
MAGHLQVDVEPMGPLGSFGSSAQRISMLFSEFIHRISEGNERLYLTTQYHGDNFCNRHHFSGLSDEDFELFSSTFPPPVCALLGSIPLKPELLSGYALEQVNLWIGRSTDGSSSGLHHDFHDNLYVLIGGRKRFTLFPPSDFKKMRLHGNPCRLHWNGLLNYEKVTRSDGATDDIISEFAIDKALEEKFGNLFESEEHIDKALESQLDAEIDFERRKKRKKQENPPSFSKIPAGFLHNGSRSDDRDLNRAEVILNPGDALFLPASWFHEVTSWSDGISKVHMAVNYWCNPPSNESLTESGCFYVDDMWPQKSQHALMCAEKILKPKRRVRRRRKHAVVKIPAPTVTEQKL